MRHIYPKILFIMLLLAAYQNNRPKKSKPAAPIDPSCESESVTNLAANGKSKIVICDGLGSDCPEVKNYSHRKTVELEGRDAKPIYLLR